ncbi:MAG: formimidoylglutamase [Candidatus Planktophila sp.]|nr:formimidoylglutamase [Candidatus Planktophila sp.]
MSVRGLSKDEKWPRANTLFDSSLISADFALLGIPAHETSLSSTSAHLTPSAVREALARYSTFAESTSSDLRSISMTDLGDIDSPDFVDGESRVANFASDLLNRHKLIVALGGDNSITYSLAKGLWIDVQNIGVITFDAHHDLRDGESNGSPLWRLIQAGLPGKNIVQIGIADFANSSEYADRAKEHGVTVITRAEMRSTTMPETIRKALDIAGMHGRDIYVDVDVDVCDRSVAPACPASLPGGISADELRHGVRLIASDKRVRALDITEIDAAIDTDDQRTVRLAALLVLEAAAGLASR